MELPQELQFEKLSLEEKYRRAIPGFMKRVADIYAAIYERFGEEGLELIREVSAGYGTRIGENVNKKGGLKGVADVGRYLLKVFDMIAAEWEVSEFTDDRMVIRVRSCPYAFTDDAICRAHTCMEQALVATLDETLEYRLGCTIPQGDSVCEHILSTRWR